MPRSGLQCEKMVAEPYMDGRKRACVRSGQHVRVVNGVTVFYCWQHAKQHDGWAEVQSLLEEGGGYRGEQQVAEDSE